MDVLARLRSDMEDAGREACACGEDETDACLEILDEFIGEHEVVEGEMSRHVCDEDGCCSGWETMPRLAIIPRERKPSLLEAAKRMDRACGQVVIHSGRGDNIDEFHAAQRGLAEAIEKEKSNA